MKTPESNLPRRSEVTAGAQSPKPAAEYIPTPLLVMICAPSGGGKTTLCNQLLVARPEMTRAVTCTTREPRKGEKEGVDYYFFSAAEFERRVAAGEFIEHATVFGRGYGILKSELLDKLHSGRNVLLNVDVQGAATIRSRAKTEPPLNRALVSVFLAPPSIAELENRLRNRATDSEAEIQKRLAVARREIAHWIHFDYLLTSTTKAEDLRRMLVIFEAEKMRAARAQAPEF